MCVHFCEEYNYLKSAKTTKQAFVPNLKLDANLYKYSDGLLKMKQTFVRITLQVNKFCTHTVP